MNGRDAWPLSPLTAPAPSIRICIPSTRHRRSTWAATRGMMNKHATTAQTTPMQPSHGTTTHHFHLAITWNGGRNGSGTVSSGHLATPISIDRQMGGPGLGTNPDECCSVPPAAVT